MDVLSIDCMFKVLEEADPRSYCRLLRTCKLIYRLGGPLLSAKKSQSIVRRNIGDGTFYSEYPNGVKHGPVRIKRSDGSFDRFSYYNGIIEGLFESTEVNASGKMTRVYRALWKDGRPPDLKAYKQRCAEYLSPYGIMH